MSTREDEFQQQLRATFRVEAAEHLQAIETGLLKLEKASTPKEQHPIVEVVFRAAHSLKGAARAANFIEIESICQSLEDVFASWKRQEAAPSTKALDTLHRALNTINAVLSGPEAASASGTFAPPSQGEKPVRSEPGRAAPIPAEVAVYAPASTAERVSREETVRIAVTKLDARLVEAEEMVAAKLTTGQRADDLRELVARFETWRKEWVAVESDARALRQAVDRPAPVRAERQLASLARLLGFLDWNVDYLKSLENSVSALTRTAEQDRHAIGKLVDDLLQDSKKLLLLPFGTLSASFPKLVRDLCRDQGKEAELVVHGEDVEIDKRILEEIKDPLIHLLRNCIDHGVETPEARSQLGKSPRATITLALSRVNGSKVELSVADDGAGLDIEEVKKSAVKHGLLTEEQARGLSDAEARGLIFQADVSTSPIITRLSGRGLGLAIVREKAEKLNGEVSVESEPRVGTCMRVVLPAMLATFRGILIETAGRSFIVPTVHVERVAHLRPEEVQTVEGYETISINGRAIALVRLSGMLELPQPARTSEPVAAPSVIVIGGGENRIAFAVDSVLAEQEVLVKPLRKPLARVRNIAGATVLGSGQVVPILNVADLLKSARKAGAVPAHIATRTKPDATEAKAILVAEDSITSRMLLKNILESAGYRVKTAVDGLDAFTLLRSERFDLVVSDVEMPRMDGFDLTAKIRADKKLAEVPVVLVTARESREDRERGIDVGASAYLVKSSFDQSNLLEAVRRLV